MNLKTVVGHLVGSPAASSVAARNLGAGGAQRRRGCDEGAAVRINHCKHSRLGLAFSPRPDRLIVCADRPFRRQGLAGYSRPVPHLWGGLDGCGLPTCHIDRLGAGTIWRTEGPHARSDVQYYFTKAYVHKSV